MHAADGFARATGKVGVALTTTGPGAANALAAFGEAWAAGSPVLHLTTQVASSDLASDVQRGILHQSPGQREAFRPLAPFAASVKSAAEAAGTTGLAIAHATGRLGGHVSGIQRPGPVYVEVPFDVLDRDADDGPDADHRIPAMWSAREPVTYDDAVEALGVATAPVVWAGGGVVASGAFEALARVAERFAAPVVTTYLGRTAIPASHPLAVAISPHEPAVPVNAEAAARADRSPDCGADTPKAPRAGGVHSPCPRHRAPFRPASTSCARTRRGTATCA